MDNLYLKKIIVIVGFMASGKTSIGKALAKKIKIPFIDSDKMIESQLNLKVSDIFAQKGEFFFRDQEEKVIEEVLKTHPVSVLSLGGGSLGRQKTIDNVQDHGFCIWLDVPLDIIMKRVNLNDTRPLLAADKFSSEEERVAFAKEILDTRTPTYKKIGHRVDAALPVKKTIDNIINLLISQKVLLPSN